MLRDFKIFRRHSGKSNVPEGNENLPAEPSDGSSDPKALDPARAPLNAIQEQVQNPKSGLLGQELGHRGKIDRTPSRMKRKGGPDCAPLPFPTPERLGIGPSAAASRARFGKTESGGSEVQEETRAESVHLLPPGRGGGNGNGGFTSMTPRAVRNAGKAVSSNHSESGSAWSTQSTPTKSVTKPPNPAFAHSNGCRPPLSLGARAGNFAALSKGISVSSVTSTVVNSVEVPYFELKEDPSFWLDHNVQVLIRVRPLNSTERGSYGYNRCLKQESAQCVTWIGQPETRFTFDHVACETVNQEMLFRVAGLPMVENCLSGYNSCMFAYGQTGSGKTYTMLGEIDDLEVRPSTYRGMTPRIFEFLFARIRAEEESRQDEKLKYNCKCSFLEIYNEQITDLLDPCSTNLLLREDNRKGVYVENLTEIEVETVSDIIRLLIQGAANRKVAATNMNRESSRSHSVFTCVIESQWEKDSAINLRFARLNLVDLAGSERQKTSGAEGERLKEAANINKSLSTLGHVIMLLVDVAQGKQRHVPYRDSRLTFLLQDSLGGNSKTMIIANVSPSICCAAETLSTLKFAQRAKLIQNNAVVNEDASGDVIALQHRIRLLKEELSLLKRQNVSRSLSFRSAIFGDSDNEGQDAAPKGKIPKVGHEDVDESHGCESLGIVRVSTKQLKSLETTLAGALRREQMADGAVKQLEAEIEQLNRLVRHREEDTRCTKMMLKFREEKIHRMKSFLDGLTPIDSYLLEENNALTEEIQLLRARLDKNPEVTRFALENIRLLDQLRRFQDFYEEGEREILLAEVSEMRDQLVQLLDGNYGQDSCLNMSIATQGRETSHHRSADDSKEDLLQIELKNTREELVDCRKNLHYCTELNGKLSMETDDLKSQLRKLKNACYDQVPNVEPHEDHCYHGFCSAETETSDPHLLEAKPKKTADWTHEIMGKHDEDILKLQLELDIVKSILEEERASRGELEERALRDADLANEKYFQISEQCEHAQNELKHARSVIEALESQQFLSFSEMEEIRESNERYMELLKKQEQEISILKEQLAGNLEGNGKLSSSYQELRDQPFKRSENGDSPLKAKMKRMQNSLEMARMLNMRYQNDQAYQITNEQEMDEVRMQVEAETAEVIVCMQEELAALQQQAADSNAKELEMKHQLMLLETESQELKERINLMTQDNERLGELLEKKDEDLRKSSEEWERLACEIAETLSSGHEALEDASDQVDFIAESFPQRRSWIGEQVERMVRTICEKDLLIEELQQCLEDAHKIRSDMDLKLWSLRGATLAITEAQQQQSSEREKEVLLLTSQLNSKLSIIADFEERVKLAEDQIKKAELCATVAFMTVNRLTEINSIHLEELKHKELQLNEYVEIDLRRDALSQEQAHVIAEADRQIEALKAQLEGWEESAAELKVKLLEEQEHVRAMEQQLAKAEKDFAESKAADDLLKVKEKLNEFNMGVHTLNSCMREYVEDVRRPDKVQTPEKHAATFMESADSSPTEIEMTPGIIGAESHDDQNNTEDRKERSVDGCVHENSFKVGKSISDSTEWKVIGFQCGQEEFRNGTTPEDVTILLLRKEIECALDSLKGVQIQMRKIVDEKEEVKNSEKQSRESIKCLTGQVLRLETQMNDMEKQFDFRVAELNHKLKVMGETVKDADSYFSQAKEVLELELCDAKVLAFQKVAEASSILAKFEEAQDTMKEANIMVNALVAANETSKLEIERFQKTEMSLVNEVQNLQSTNVQKEQEYELLETQFHSNLEETRNLVQVLEDIVSKLQTSLKEELMSVVSDIHFVKYQFLHSANLTRTWLEDIWSEIIRKDCAMSVLHLCHIGILLETVTGLNAENSFLHHGLNESNSIIADLKKHNFRAKRELEMCSVLKGKLLVDLKNSFRRITRKEDETGELSSKLSSFEKKISDLQLQEESMLARSNSMGSELALLVRELNMNNRNALASLLDKKKLLEERDFIFKELDGLINDPLSGSDDISSSLQAGNIELMEGIRNYKDLIQTQTEVILMDLSAKDLELLFLTSELEQKTTGLQHLAVLMIDLEKGRDKLRTLLENLKREMIFVKVDEELEKQISMDVIVEVALLKDVVAEMQHQLDLAQSVRDDLLLKFNQSSERAAKLENEKKAIEIEILSLKEVSDKQLSDLSSQSTQRIRLQDLHDEVGLLQDLISRQQNSLDEKSRELTEVNGCYDISLKELESKNQEMEIQIKRMNVVVNANEALKCELNEATEARDKLSAQIQVLKIETEGLSKDLQMKETALEGSSNRVSVLDVENQKLQDDISFLQSSISRLQTELDSKTSEVTKIQQSNSIALDNFELEKQEMLNLMGKIDALEVENEKLKSEAQNIKTEHHRVLEDLQRRSLELESCSSSMCVFDQKNHKLQETICSLEACITSLHQDLDMKDIELKEVCSSHSIIAKELDVRTHDIDIQINLVNALKAENSSLRSETMFANQKKDEILTLVDLNLERFFVAMPAMDLIEKKVFQVLDGRRTALLDVMFQKYSEFEEMVSNFITESEHLEMFAQELISENSSLQAELVRKDEVLEGLSFDLSLLQESASNAMDHKDEFEKIAIALETVEDELVLKSNELDEAVSHGQMLEAQLLEKDERISALELDLSKEQESLKLFSHENLHLKAHVDELLVTKNSIEDELMEKSKITERLEEELIEMSTSLEKLNFYLEGLKDDLIKVTSERDYLDSEVLSLKEQMEMTRALAEENEAIATEARQIAESKKTYAEDKEEEVRLLEKSVEELESTINVLENQVEIIKQEAERQRLEREELEMELQTVKHQMSVHTFGENMNLEIQNIKRDGGEGFRRSFEEKLRDLEEAQKKIHSLEKELAEKDAEIAHCREHISELNMHAEAQGLEYKQKFKALEAMAQQVKPEPVSSNTVNATATKLDKNPSTATKLDKNPSKSRGSGSPFKCIGLGLTHQINSEKDEELTAGRHRIEELEAVAASRQKEIFMLNARLAAAESMTHDVIRDLLGVKLDMTNYASLLDHQQVQKITERARFHSEEAQEKGQEVIKLKQQLNEFIEERQGWLDEINRRHAEMVAAQVALEKLRQRDHFLTTENEMLKMDNVNHKKKAMELEDEMKKLSGQQNLQQRIHHHAKIKEENNSLKTQKEDLSARLRRTESLLSRMKEELSRYRASSGKNPYIDIDKEQQLKRKLEDTEEERVQLAQKLLNLCTSILKAAGITLPLSDISPSVAEEALTQLKDRIASTERELQDWKFKSKISSEKMRLSELRQQPSPLSSRPDENCHTPRRMSRTSPLSSLR